MPEDSLSELEEEALAHLFTMDPGYAVSLGLHEYDGLLPTLSKEQVAAWTLKAEQLLRRLSEVDRSGLPPRRGLDSELLQMFLEKAIFEFRELRSYLEDPLTYVFRLNVQSYIIRDYAPPERRVRAIVKHLKVIPQFLKLAEENLFKILPRPHVMTAIDFAKGTPANFREAEQLAEKVSAELRSEFTEAEKDAISAVLRFVKLLQDDYLPRAKNDFALGREKLTKLLWLNDRVDKPLDEVLEMGLRDTEQNKNEFIKHAKSIDPSNSPQEVLKQIALNHSKAETLIKDTENLLEDIRQYIIDEKIVSIPSEERCQVIETPTFARGVYTAAMDSPGPFEVGSKRAFYYVTPVSAEWSDERKEQWLRYLNTTSLKGISIHEAYPGHYVHFLHQKLLQTKASKAFFSYAFTEGWAHYCEEMLLQERYGVGDKGLRLGQLQAALVRDCRFVCAIKMHTGQFTLEQATQFFMENAFVDQLPAEREAMRGAFDPGYYSYTLGKLYIKAVREKFFAKHPNSDLKEFHDRLLSWGAPPVGMLERVMA